MIETGLIIAQVAFLVLLYVFVWSVVRSSGRQLQDQEPQPRASVDTPSPIVGPPPDLEPEPFPEPEPVLEPEPVPALAPDTPAGLALEATDGAPGVPLEGAPAESVPVEPPPGQPVPPPRRRSGDTGVLDLSDHIDPKLVVEDSKALPPGEEIGLAGGLTIGRSGANDVSIEDPFVSHIHARILRRGPYYFVEDLGSTNGTYLNDQRVDGDARLKMRDTLRLGETVLRYEE